MTHKPGATARAGALNWMDPLPQPAFDRDPLDTDALAAVRATLLATADAAAAAALPLFRTPIAIDNKWTVGFDPVTAADRDAETAIRAIIAARFPEHGIVGEEWADKRSGSPFCWIVDPIDGTRAFIAGVPVWGTLIGLTLDGRPLAGMMAQPFTGERWLALPGEAHYTRAGTAVPLATSGVTDLARARLTATSPDLFQPPISETLEQWQAVSARAMTVRYGLDSYGYCLLAMGHIDLVVEAGLKIVDIAPLVPIIEGAGGVVTTWQGERPEHGGNIVAAATPELHRQALAVLRGG